MTAADGLRDPLDRIAVVVPRGATIRDLLEAPASLPFSPPILAFVENLGRALRSDPAVRRHPELVALGFWARAANIRRLQARFDAPYPEAVRLARGVAFHIAPSNVDTIFVYSLLLSMLAGNVNLVRVSSRAGDQANLLMEVFAKTLESADPSVRNATAIVRYEHDRAITDALSRAADLRIVWGGDATVQLVRESPLAPSGTELVFPNKYSLAVIDAAAWLAEPDQAAVARAFVNDSLWFGQAACSSPRTVVWRGSDADFTAASESFWRMIETGAEAAGFEIEDAHAVAKLLAEQGAAIDEWIAIRPSLTNRVRVLDCELAHLVQTPGVGNGYFRETRIDRLEQLTGLAQADWQTIVSFGVPDADWRATLAANPRARGIDRIVRVGTALDFDAIWDGKDLLASMSRLVIIAL